MVSDTKRGATAYKKAVRHMQWGFGMSEPDAKRAMAAILDAGLHVVTAADKAVLDEMVNVNSAWLEEVSKTSCGPLGSACRAELARRGLK